LEALRPRWLAATRHSGLRRSAQVSIRLYTEGGQLHLEVRDDGHGFELSAAHDGVGVQNMRDRIGAVGGRVEIDSHPGHGTLVSAIAPVTVPHLNTQAAAAEPTVA
jgi:signal transduction histidine kinase